ncbi:hypothetical protein GGQ97_001060 [Sphingomonas kaistensis]|uniref:Uncharacterized protein n=1 Tax=Sphingomonas kaistensis TaxID=298708 RepID=A0A7X5Y619_9SPHN|nr:hypothetical protein [Sphingomonas kaistensis]
MAGTLNGDELGAVLASIGPNGGDGDRLAAVVALLANRGSDAGKMVRGAFAGAGPVDARAKVRSAFTSALHGCLREPPVNAGSPATTSSV